MLCAPTETDIAAALGAFERGNVWPGIMQTTATNGVGADAGAGVGEVPAPARTVIGSAVHGMYSYRRGCGVAAGLIAAPALARLLIDCGRLQCRAPLVLVRNTTSLQYRLACLSVSAAEQ
jgi:hypothetical protein